MQGRGKVSIKILPHGPGAGPGTSNVRALYGHHFKQSKKLYFTHYCFLTSVLRFMACMRHSTQLMRRNQLILVLKEYHKFCAE